MLKLKRSENILLLVVHTGLMHFTPLCFLVDGLTGCEASSFIRLSASGLAARWDRSYSDVVSWVRARFGFALVRATVLCLCGSLTRWRCLGFEDAWCSNIDDN